MRESQSGWFMIPSQGLRDYGATLLAYLGQKSGAWPLGLRGIDHSSSRSPGLPPPSQRARVNTRQYGRYTFNWTPLTRLPLTSAMALSVLSTCSKKMSHLMWEFWVAGSGSGSRCLLHLNLQEFFIICKNVLFVFSLKKLIISNRSSSYQE